MDRVQVRLPAENRPLLLEQLFPGADYSVIACDRRNCAAVMAPAAAPRGGLEHAGARRMRVRGLVRGRDGIEYRRLGVSSEQEVRQSGLAAC